jgi:L-lactate dehydrogenase complex protein LldE
MRVALLVPCFVDQLAPQVGLASARLLARLGCEVRCAPEQTCCGQPFLTSGALREARRLAERQLRLLEDADAVVCPSASCAAMVRVRYPRLLGPEDPRAQRIASRCFELGEFVARELGGAPPHARFAHRVALLQSCHGLRDLGLGRPSESTSAPAGPGPIEALLRAVQGLELVAPERDECCGFGGLFAVDFPELSARIGRDRLRALAATGAEYVTGTDTTCLLHLDGLRRREGFGPRPIHLAEILCSGVRPDGNA